MSRINIIKMVPPKKPLINPDVFSAGMTAIEFAIVVLPTVVKVYSYYRFIRCFV